MQPTDRQKTPISVLLPVRVSCEFSPVLSELDHKRIEVGKRTGELRADGKHRVKTNMIHQGKGACYCVHNRIF